MITNSTLAARRKFVQRRREDGLLLDISCDGPPSALVSFLDEFPPKKHKHEEQAAATASFDHWRRLKCLRWWLFCLKMPCNPSTGSIGVTLITDIKQFLPRTYLLIWLRQITNWSGGLCQSFFLTFYKFTKKDDKCSSEQILGPYSLSMDEPSRETLGLWGRCRGDNFKTNSALANYSRFSIILFPDVSNV